MHILIAPNAFKGSLGALEAAEAIKRGFLKSKLQAECSTFPIADGGDGTMEILINKLGGQMISVSVEDPLQRPMETKYGWQAESKTAIIEMANASGIKWLGNNELNPWKTSSFGTGQLIRHALERGAKTIILGLGGSATVDGGTGILQALGLRLLNKKGENIRKGAQGLAELDQLDMQHIHPSLNSCKIVVACDVENPLLGENGAARVFGPQKGATPKMVEALEKHLGRFRELVQEKLHKDIGPLKHGGAAGGISAALWAFFNAELVSGIEFLLKATGFVEALQEADLLVTAEGRIDGQTFGGKGPMGAALLARRHHVPVIMLAGQVPDQINSKGLSLTDAIFSISPGPGPLEEAIQNTEKDLERTAFQIGNLLTLKIKDE